MFLSHFYPAVKRYDARHPLVCPWQLLILQVRLALAQLIWSPPHLLVLDEVTTHLDSDSIVALAKGLNAYEGALLVVTHDRFFMRSVVEGENPFDEEEEVEWDEERKGDVFLLEKGQLRLLQGGVAAYEKRALKAVKRIKAG
jgi:ATP-binding cassette subfamily F protein 3